MEIYSQIADTNSFGAEAILLGFLVLIVGLLYSSETFERLVGSRVKGPLYLAHGTVVLPLMLLLEEIQKTRRGGGGILRFFGILIIVVIVVIIGILALIAFLIYRFVRRRG